MVTKRERDLGQDKGSYLRIFYRTRHIGGSKTRPRGRITPKNKNKYKNKLKNKNPDAQVQKFSSSPSEQSFMIYTLSNNNS